MEKNLNIEAKDLQISFVDIFEFIKESWALLISAGLVGVVLGLGSWLAFADYKADLLIQNNGRFSIASWRNAQNILPKLAIAILEKKEVPDNQIDIFKKMSEPIWWSKNVQINYAITKGDSKNFAAISKDLDNLASTIASFNFSAKAPSASKALDDVRSLVQFIENSKVYIDIINLLETYEIKTLFVNAEIQQKISENEIHMAYLEKRVIHLQQLQKSYPDNPKITQQIQQMVDSKDASAKYLPLSTQIIGSKNDVAMTNENLKRLNDELSRIKMIKVFLDAATLIKSGRYDGLTILKDLLALEEKLRSATARNDVIALYSLDTIRAELLKIKAESLSRSQFNTIPTVSRTGMLKSLLAGFCLTFFAMLALLLGRKLFTFHPRLT